MATVNDVIDAHPMNTQALMASPFAQMLAPDDVFRALRASATLGELPGRICRPLDKFEVASTGNSFVTAEENALPAEPARFDD